MTRWVSRTRYAVIAIAGLAISQGLYAQCANNPNAGAGSTCFGSFSMVNSNGSAIFDIAFGDGTLNSNTSGAFDTAMGSWALASNTTGTDNTGIGHNALSGNATGTQNTALGSWALASGATTTANTAVGYGTLVSSAVGSYNTAVGWQALTNDWTGNNVAIGASALTSDQTGGNNTALGSFALESLMSGNANLALGVAAGVAYSGGESGNVLIANYGVAGESNTMRLGMTANQTRTFVAGIYGVTSASGVPVYVNSSGQLGTMTSSLRFKEDVADMGAASDELLELRPVTFHYKAPYDDGQGVLQYGLIAEEVAAVDPNLVQFGDDGQPLTVRYHLVNAMLLGEVQKLHARLTEQATRISEQEAEIVALAARLSRLEAAAAPNR